jgi:hypothetical protein
MILVRCEAQAEIEARSRHDSSQGRNGRLPPPRFIGGHNGLGHAESICQLSLRQTRLQSGRENEAAGNRWALVQPRRHVRNIDECLYPRSKVVRPARERGPDRRRAEGARRPLRTTAHNDYALPFYQPMQHAPRPFSSCALGLDGCLAMTTRVHRVRFPGRGAPPEGRAVGGRSSSRRQLDTPGPAYCGARRLLPARPRVRPRSSNFERTSARRA